MRTTAENVQIDCVVPELLTCHYSDWCPTLGTCRQKLPAAGRWRCPVCRQPQHRTLLAETRRLRRPFGRETWKFLLEIPVKIGCILFTLKKKKKKNSHSYSAAGLARAKFLSIRPRTFHEHSFRVQKPVSTDVVYCRGGFAAPLHSKLIDSQHTCVVNVALLQTPSSVIRPPLPLSSNWQSRSLP